MRLTPAQNRVLHLLAEGYLNKQIASKLGIAESTVEQHRREVIARLDARNATHAVALAIGNGIIDAPGIKSKSAT